MKIAVVGAGAIGGYLGAKLAIAGEEVTFIARNKNLAAINANGFRLILEDGSEQHAPTVCAVQNMADAGPQDVVLLTVKAHQVVDLLPGLRVLVAPLTTALMVSARADPAIDGLSETSSQEDMALAMAKAVARRALLDWEGVGDEAGNLVPVSQAGIDALLEIWPVFEAFQAQYVAKALLLDAEKNASAPSPTGPSAGATATVRPAQAPVRTAPHD